jgi:hypothetical protein
MQGPKSKIVFLLPLVRDGHRRTSTSQELLALMSPGLWEARGSTEVWNGERMAKGSRGCAHQRRERREAAGFLEMSERWRWRPMGLLIPVPGQMGRRLGGTGGRGEEEGLRELLTAGGD